MKFARIITPIIICGMLFVALINIIPQTCAAGGECNSLSRSIASTFQVPTTLYVKLTGILIISFAVIFISLFTKGYINITLFMAAYSITSIGFLSSVIYTETTKGIDTYPYISFGFALLIFFVLSSHELYQRYKTKKIASNCFKGSRLKDYAKAPWKFSGETKKVKLSLLYFDIPELRLLATKFDTDTLTKIIDFIYERSNKIIAEHNAIIIKRSDDSLLLALEPGKYYEEVLSPESDCAYHSVSCALQLKQMVKDMHEFFRETCVSQLKGRVLVSTENSLIIKHIRDEKMELSLFSDGINNFQELSSYSDGSDIVIDSKTFNLCSSYFRGKELPNSTYSIIGLSAY